MHEEESINIFTKIFNQLGEKWFDFINDLKKAADVDDWNQIFLADFISVCYKYKIILSTKEKTNLLYSYPGRDEGKKVRINIYPIYEQKYNIMAKQMYEKVDLKETDPKDDAIDACGYLGVFHRKKKNLKQITEEEFI